MLRRFRFYAPALIFAALPVVHAAKLYSTAVPITALQLLRDCGILCGIALLLAIALMLLPGDDRTKGAALSIGVLLAGVYPSVAGAVDVIPCSWQDSALGAAFLFIVAAALFALARPGRHVLASLHGLLAVLVVVVVAYSGYSAVSRLFRPSAASTLAHPGGQPLTLPAGPRPPDIIHIVLDGLGRLDVLQDVYGLDSRRVQADLAAHGMTVTDGAVANYSQTFPAVAAALSMEYLDEAGIAAGGGNDRTIAEAIIRQSTVIRALKARGYAFTLLSSGYEALIDHPEADDGIRGPTLFDEFEAYLVPRTMVRALPIARLTYEPQRRRTESILRALESFQPAGRPRFVLAHLLLPHPPFRYTRDGRHVPPPGIFTIKDANMFVGTGEEYRKGYAAQAEYVFDELQHLLARSQHLRPRPIVIVHGDHGSGLGYDIRTPERSNVQGRMRIFLGVQSPVPIGPIGSPVNIYREVFRSVFGVDLSPLPDRSFVSSWGKPFDFSEVHVQ